MPERRSRFLIDHITTGTRLHKDQEFAPNDQGVHVAPEDCYVISLVQPGETPLRGSS